MISLVISTINENINKIKNIPISENVRCLIVHQIFKENIVLENKALLNNPNIEVISFNERGLSKSRNRGIENLDKGTDYILLSDDDVSFVKDLEEIINQSFKENPDADIITFQSLTPDGMTRRKYKDKPFRHNKRTIKNVSSIEIVIKYNSIRKKNIFFDERFGLGSLFPSGEEVVFLMDCLRKKLKIKYIPKPISIHPFESTGSMNNSKDNINESILQLKGALSKRLFPKTYILINIIIIIKSYIRFYNRFSLKTVIRSIFNGSKKL